MAAFESCSTIEELAIYFTAKTSNLKRCMETRNSGSSSHCVSVLRSIDKELQEIEQELANFKQHVNCEKQNLAEAKAMKDIVLEYAERQKYISSHLPSHLPGNTAVEKATRPTSPNEERPKRKRRQNGKQGDSSFTMNSTSVGQLHAAMPYLTTEEFSTVPKYMKGRITYDQVNSAIDEINKVVTAKYKILSLPRSAMGEPVMKKYKAFKEAEVPETQGQYFFVENDLKTYSQFKVDGTGRSILTILRHCGRLKEVRSKGLLRYVLKQ